jgi:hypothetical protein
VFHLPFNLPGPIVTTRSKHSHWLMPFERYRENEGVRAIGLIACSATEVMMQRQSGKVCVPATSCLCLPSVTPNMAVGWGDGAGW